MQLREFVSRFHHIRHVPPVQDYPLRQPGKPAAVLMPIVQREELTLLLTKRASHLKHHAGQISFPGGKWEHSDNSLVDTALRESTEEIGLAPQHVELLGNLNPFRTISRYEVTPIIGVVTPPFELTLDANEVETVFEVPLRYVLNRRNHLTKMITREKLRYPVYFIPWQDQLIWGATAAFIRELADHIDL